MSGRVFGIGGYVNGLKVVNQACVGWRNSKYSIGMNRKSFGLFTFTVFCSINVIDHICYRKEEFEELLFTTKFNTPLNSQIIIDAIHKIVKTINETRYYIEEIEDFSCHCFRHTFATRCFEAGIQPKTVQKYLGHATLQMTMDLYTSVMPKHLSDEMGKLDNELDKISRSGEDLIDSRYKKETKKDILDFPGNTVAV